MDLNTKVILKRMKSMGMGLMSGQMGKFMKEIGRVIR